MSTAAEWRRHLEELRNELGQIQPDATDDTRHLQAAREHVQALLETDEAPPSGAVERLEELARHLEVTHPKLAFSARRITTVLANLGL